MKNVIALIACVAALSFTTWQPDFNKARQEAKANHQLILLNFSGSDWCGPCMMMRKNFFESQVFSEMADSNLVMVNADFPRKKKNQLNKEIADQNDELAEQYNPSGKFPYTILLDENGKVLKAWDGLPEESPEKFTKSIKNIIDARSPR
jgi:thioredoxin-related protein